MGYWVEVTTGLRWDRLFKEKNVKLEAPEKTRYRKFFQGLKTGDFVLHYLTWALTVSKEKKGRVVAVSRVASDPIPINRKIVAKCSNTVLLPKPVPCHVLHEIDQKSKGLQKLLNLNMQRYLTQITEANLISILSVSPENNKVLKKVYSLKRS